MAEEVKKTTAFGDNKVEVAVAENTENVVNKKDIDYTYDSPFKRLFKNKVFLSPILKNIVPEYRELELEAIEQLITVDVNVTVNPMMYDSEDSGKGSETTTHYDALVSCLLPDGSAVWVGFYFDLEMQRENDPKYPLVKRGVYYCSRLISRQIERLGKESYNQLLPVYSVWIVINNIPEELQNSVYTLKLEGSSSKEGLDVTALNRDADLIHLSMIYLNEDFKSEKESNDLIKYLQSVFLKQIGNSAYNPYYDYSEQIEREVDEIMSVEEAFEARGETRGEARGEAKGMIRMLLKYHESEDVIIKTLIAELSITPKEANNYLEMYYDSCKEG